MLRIWLVRISPAIGKLESRTTLVGNGRTRRDRTDDRQTGILGEGGRRNYQSRAPAGLFAAFGRVEVRPDKIA
jgi:hypothetical protein